MDLYGLIWILDQIHWIFKYIDYAKLEWDSRFRITCIIFSFQREFSNYNNIIKTTLLFIDWFNFDGGNL